MVSWLNGSSGACRCHEERVNWKLLEMIFVEQLMFHIPKRLGEIHMDLMRVYETFCLIPQGIQFLFTVLLDVHDLRGVVNTLAVLKYLDRKFPHRVGSRSEKCLFPGRDRVKEQQRFVLVEGLTDETDNVRDDLVAVLSVDTVGGLVARVCDLLLVLGELDLRDEGSGLFIHDRRELINAAEGRAVFGGDQVCSDTPGVDGCALVL